MRRGIGLFAAFLLLLVALSTLPPQVIADSGGYSWRASTGGRIRGRPVSTRDGVVYLLSEDRHLYALEESSGRMKWRTYLGGRVWDSLCIGSDGTVYTVLKDGDLVAIGRGGGIAWKFKAAGLPVGNPAAASDGTVYFTLETGELYAVSHTGREIWKTSLGAPPVTGPAVGVSGDVYVGLKDRRIVSFRAWGEKRWNALLAGAPTEPAIADDGTIYYGTDFGSVVALDPSGAILWDYVAGAGFLAPVLGSERILAATRAGRVVALTPEGDVLWQADAGAGLTGYLTVTAGNDLIALSNNGFLIRFRDTGELVERYDVRGSGSLFSVTPKGKYVFGRDDWLVYAFPGSLPAGGWSQPGGDPQHSSSAFDYTDVESRLSIFRDNVEFIILDALVHDEDPDLKSRALSEITTGIRSSVAVPPYYRYFLYELAAEGTLHTVREYGAITNDFPGIRGSAAELLGKIGTLQSSDFLVRLLRYEYDSEVQRKIIRALGDLMTDRDGSATAAISQVVRTDLGRRKTPDPRLAESALLALQSIQGYNGVMPHDSGSELVFAVYRGAYPKETRALALSVMRSLK